MNLWTVFCLCSMIQGTYCIVETVVPSRELHQSGEQLCVLLGFRTTDDNCVDTLEADSERSQEARSWRDWTGIGTLYQNLCMEHCVEVTKIEFLESHVPYHSAIFHYIVLVYLQGCSFIKGFPTNVNMSLIFPHQVNILFGTPSITKSKV